MPIFMMRRRMRSGCVPERADAGTPIVYAEEEGGMDERDFEGSINWYIYDDCSSVE